MYLLLAASLLWAFSFGLVKHGLVSAGMDPFIVAAVRLGLSFALFAPALRVRGVSPGLAARLVALGTVQYGVMYVAYTWAFRHLASHEVALLTVFTPLYVAAIHDGITRRFHRMFALAAAMAVSGGALVMWRSHGAGHSMLGILLVQVSNLAFAVGQVLYPRVMARYGEIGNVPVFGWLYLGGFLAALAPVFSTGALSSVASLTPPQAYTLLYLGLIPSGIGFFLWNAGARRVNAGTLAAMNNAKIPLAVLVSLLVFGERADLGTLFAGGALMFLGVLLTERRMRGAPAPCA